MCKYNYYNTTNNLIIFIDLQRILKQVKHDDVVLFHSCCHNLTCIKLTLKV
ncbi:hypothetical protein [Candidatus Profftia lariciata]|uniref:hypothetical protein n=1 Tax=Candidatus Profftia lariciata TaxID=1987921 RepID=UPI003B969D7F